MVMILYGLRLYAYDLVSFLRGKCLRLSQLRLYAFLVVD
jgi:hypothetical protein